MSIQNRMTVALSVALLAICAPVVAQTEANKAMIDLWTVLWKTADLAIADEIYTTDFVAHIPHYPDADDLEGYKEEVAKGPSYVSDWNAIVEDLIAEGDRVVGRFTAGGVWQPFGIPYTNTMIIIFRFVDGKIAEEWWEFDMLGVQQQAGAIPPSPEGPPATQRSDPEAFTWGTPADVTGDPGDPQANKALFRRELDAWDQGDVDALMTVLDEIYAPDFVYHDPARPHVTDLASYKQWAAEECFGAFPGFRMPVEDMIAEADTVAARWTFTGTHIALGRPVTQTGITIARVADGKIVEAWCACDMLGTIVQLTTPTEDELLAIADAAGEAINAHDLDGFTSFFTEDGVFDLVPFGMVFTGAEQIKAVMAGEFAAFPDWHITKPDMLAGPGIVVSEYTLGGTHQGMWNGIPPTGNAVQLPAMEIIDFEGDQIKKLTIYTDVLSEMIQLGVMPAPELPPLMPSFTLPDPEPTGLSPMEANAELLARWNTHDLGEFAKMLTADVEVYEGGFGVPMGRAECIAAHEMLLGAFPDAVGQYVRQTDLGDGWVVVEVDLTSTHNGPFMGIPPTGRPVTLRTGGLRHFNADGLVDYFALYYDMLGVMQLLTAVAPIDPGSDGLVAYYPLDADASDASGQGLDGLVMGDPVAITGAIGGAMEFDGEGDMIEIAHDAVLDITGPISLSLWIRPDAEEPEGQGTEAAPMCKAGSTASPSWSWQVRYGWNSPQPYMAFTFNTSPRAWAYVGQNLAQGEWHHIACSADGEMLTAYLNGEATESTPMGAITSSPTPVLIGSDGWGSDWIGGIDEIRIYNRALSAGEVLFLTGYMSDVTGPGDLVVGVPDDGVTTGGEDNGWPAAETPDLVIDDNVNTKYLHFKGDTGPTGLRVKPSVGSTVVTGVTFTTANDTSGRDPIAFELYGSNGSIDGPYTLIASRDIVDFAGAEEWSRFTKNATPILLNNATAYSYYQVLFTAIRGPAGGSVNSMQIAEVELFGMPLVPPPDVEANKAVARRFFEEMWNDRNLDIAAELITPETRCHDVTGEYVGYEGAQQHIMGTVMAFPDLTVTIDDMFAEDDMVAVRSTARGTHTGMLMGQIPPTGAAITMTSNILFRFAGGKIVEAWPFPDMLGVMQQVGAASPPRPAPEDYAWLPSSAVTGAPGDPEVNKRLVMRFVDEVWNAHNPDAMDELCVAEFISHNPAVDYMYGPMSLATAKQQVSAYLDALPDMYVTVHNIVAEGDKAVAYWTVNGTHGGELAGIPATGRSLTYSGATMYRFVDGKIAELWWAWDCLGMMQQIAAPAP